MAEQPATGADPYDTAELRRRVLASWADAPVRFREDANAEEDFALSGYRDRVVVELAQNAADAARRAGVPGRLLLSLEGDRLVAANTGAPLTAEGVESLATLRASAKHDGDGSVGRFGVGFSAVAALSDDVTVASAGAAVRFSADLARAAVADLTAGADPSGLAAEVDRRSGHVPMLRLPFAVDADEAPGVPGYDTTVSLVLRDGAARDRVLDLLSGTGEALLLALSGLAEIRVLADGTERVATRRTDGGDPVTTLSDAEGVRTTHWRTLTRTGEFSPDLLADRPTEERGRTAWSLTWAVPVDGGGAVAPLPPGMERVVHAPTPTDTGLDLPAVLIGTFPLGSDRRTVQPGPATDLLLSEAAEGYAALLRRFDARAALDLVPGTRVGGGRIDAGFRSRVVEPLRTTPFLTAETGAPVAPGEAVLLDTGGSALPEVLADLIPGLLPGGIDPRHPALAVLRVHRLGAADIADLLADTDRPPSWWSDLYSALADGADTDELGALPVPLADGRLVRGPRSLLVPVGTDTDRIDAESLAALGVRLVHPGAVHPLLLRLGAVEAGPAAVLTDAHTEAAVRGSLDADDPEPLAEAVLGLVAASGITAADAPWLAELALRDDEDGYSVAAELLVPGAPLCEVLADDAPFGTVHADLVDRYGTDVLRAVGALWEFTLVRAEEVALGDDVLDVFEEAPDALDEWADEVLERAGDPELPPVVPELVCAADLDYVADDRWPQALEMLSQGVLREAVTSPSRVLLPDGRVVDVPSYTAWWLRTRALVGGAAPAELRAAEADPALTGLYDEAPADIDPEFARALGVRTGLAELLEDPDGPDDLLARLADPERHVDRSALLRIWSALAGVDADLVTPPARVRAVLGGAIVVADAEETVVVDSPDLLPLLTGRPLILSAVPEDLADVLDLDLASETVDGEVSPGGSLRQVPEVADLFLDPGGEQSDRTYLHHAELVVDGVAVEWYTGDGAVHASSDDGLARALCWRAGRWDRRHLLAAALREPDAAPFLLAEADLER